MDRYDARVRLRSHSRDRARLAVGALLLGVGCGGGAPRGERGRERAAIDDTSRTPRISARIVAVYPHASDAFTQGLELHEGRLYESTGLHGRSSLRVVALESGSVLRLRSVPDAFYAEGLTISGDRLYQLTYQSGVCFVYDLETLEPRGQHAYRGEGWGLTHHEGTLVLSDGTATLRFLDPDTFTERSRLTVRDDAGPVERLNELEMVEGELFANVWRTDRIARIDPATGRVTGWIELAFLRESLHLTEPEAVLNGIAYDDASDRLFVTGKLWPKLFEIALEPAP